MKGHSEIFRETSLAKCVFFLITCAIVFVLRVEWTEQGEKRGARWKGNLWHGRDQAQHARHHIVTSIDSCSQTDLLPSVQELLDQIAAVRNITPDVRLFPFVTVRSKPPDLIHAHGDLTVVTARSE